MCSAENEDKSRYRHLNSSADSIVQTTTSQMNANSLIEVPKKSYQISNILSRENSTNRDGSMIDNQGSILVSIYNTTHGRHNNTVGTHNVEESLEMGNAWMQDKKITAFHKTNR